MIIRQEDFVDEYYSNRDLGILNKLTLVIPTYNRNYYLSRCLWYHAHFPFGQIIVADSSPEEKKIINRETVSKIREKFGANILYLEYEPETEKYGGDIYRKWGDAVLHADREYTLICADREFLFPTTLSRGLDFLIQHHDYSYVSGLKYYLRKTFEYHLSPRNFGKCSEISDSPIERYLHSINVVSPFQNSLLLNIGRTNHMKKTYTTYLYSKITDIRYGELFIGYIGHILGKSEYMDDFPFKIRDDIDFFKNTGRYIVGKESKESSCSRYPYFNQYNELGIDNEFRLNYKNTIKRMLHYAGYDESIDSVISSVVDIEKIMNYDVSCNPVNYRILQVIYKFIVNLKITRYFWNNWIPQPIKLFCQKIVKKQLHVNIPTQLIPTMMKVPNTIDFEIIVSIVNKTYKNHITDTAITFNPKEW